MINQIILSCNENPLYSTFWKPVSWAYRRMFPGVKVHLALLTNDDLFAAEMAAHGDVTVFPVLPDIPEFAQAKMIRFILASQQGSDVCYIDDIDLFPLNKQFITNKTSKRPAGTLLCVGGEVYRNNGCYPVSQMTAEGNTWKRFINPEELPYDILMHSYLGPTKFDVREDMLIETDWDKDRYFSDERLLRRLLSVNPVRKYEMRRGYDGSNIQKIMEATIDRHDWQINPEKLAAHGYMNAHGTRPYKQEQYQPLIDYIEQNFPE